MGPWIWDPGTGIWDPGYGTLRLGYTMGWALAIPTRNTPWYYPTTPGTPLPLPVHVAVHGGEAELALLNA